MADRGPWHCKRRPLEIPIGSFTGNRRIVSRRARAGPEFEYVGTASWATSRIACAPFSLSTLFTRVPLVTKGTRVEQVAASLPGRGESRVFLRRERPSSSSFSASGDESLGKKESLRAPVSLVARRWPRGMHFHLAFRT